MKLRIHRNSIRIRLSQSELTRFMADGRLEETIYLGREAGAALTYVLCEDRLRQNIDVEYSDGRVTISLPTAEASRWSSTDQIGISGEIDLGVRGTLSVLIEKDFACLDRSDKENADTFPNPLAAHAC